MPVLRFEPTGKTITVPAGTELLEAAAKADVKISTPCGAKGTCGKCIVKVTSGELRAENHGLLSAEAIRSGFVHACKSRVSDLDLTIEVPVAAEKHGQFADARQDFERINPSLFPSEWQLNPMACLEKIQVPPSVSEDGLSDWDRLVKTIKNKYGKLDISASLPVLQKLADALRSEQGKISLILLPGENSLRIIDLKPGHTLSEIFGIAVDLGTTSVSVILTAFPSNRIVGTKTEYNQQISCGSDVISRINYAGKPDRLEELRKLALKSINGLLAELIKEKGIEQELICSGVISGNTTMIHLLLGLNPDYIRLEPYTPTLLEVPGLKASHIGLEIHPEAILHISPAVGSYVGGDITAGLLCTDLAEPLDDIIVFLDIGTNGELVLGNRDFILSCACSAGPAFEGGAISCGMRATRGAVESVTIDRETSKAEVEIIGNSKARGICGSGIISLLAGLFSSGWIEPSGKLNRSKSSPYILTQGRQASFIIVPDHESQSGVALTISEAEIENIIRAKAAIYSACSLMLNQVGIDPESISKFYIAGGFGHYLDLDDCITIGLLPDLPRDVFKFLGNTSLIGSQMLLTSQDFHLRQQNLSRRITYIDLGSDPDYMDQYTAALFLPHTDSSRFPSVK
jgi:uncharacterized 2Fe-2S/4Fe-4S cluster protein (DUF4445 family)